MNRVLRKISRRKRDEATGKWSRLHNEEIHDQIWETGLIYSAFLWRQLRKGYYFEDGGVNMRIIFMDFQELELRELGFD